MPGHIFSVNRHSVSKLFAERQIYHRSGGEVRFITLSPQFQIIAAFGTLFVAAWLVFSTGSAVVAMLDSMRNEVINNRMKSQYNFLLDDARADRVSAVAMLQTRAKRFQQKAEDFNRRHETLEQLLFQASGELSMQPSHGEVRMLAAKDDYNPRERRVQFSDRSKLLKNLPNEDVGEEEMVAAISRRQDEVIAALEEIYQDSFEEFRSIVEIAGLNSVEYAKRLNETAVGGPFLAIEDEERLASAIEDPFVRRALRVQTRIQQERALRNVVNALPLAYPVYENTRKSSGYGVRIDPFRGSYARHHGLDFAGKHLQPVMAAAPGTISFVGWKSNYGRVVEIDHGNDFMTRYAHLQATYVEEGQEVALGEKIAGMGSTGRSTGTHLHYEVWLGKRTLNPANFLRAGKHVFKQEEIREKS